MNTIPLSVLPPDLSKNTSTTGSPTAKKLTSGGYGWYSTVFDIRKDWEGRSLDILIGAVDEQAWVYFNGHYVGEHSEKSEKVGIGVLWNEPFIIKVPQKYINYGGKNLLQIKTHASRGSHGIWNAVQIRPVDASATY